MKMEEEHQVLLPTEIESYVFGLHISDLTDIGSPKWFQQTERLRKLSLQAVFDVQSEKEELVKEHLVTLQKVLLLIHELITTEVWRLKVFPHLIQMDSQLKSSIPIYIVIYHEVSIVSLLEAVLFHEEVAESSSDLLIDLTDYCYRQIILLSGVKIQMEEVSSGVLKEPTEREQLGEQRNQIAFETGIKCISLLSYITQHLKTLPLSVLHRVLVTHDIPLLFTQLISEPPWQRTVDGHAEKYCDGKWKKKPQHVLLLNKVEGQIWIALIQLLLNPDFQKKYDMSEYKKEQLLKLRARLNDVIIDQIPILKELLRYLEHLSLFDAPAPKPGVIIEQIPEVWEYLQNKHKKKWKEIAEKQMKDYFSLSENQLQKFCAKLTDSFDLTNIEAMLTDQPVCAQCRGKGLKRCSRCKNEWYCGRPCQVSHWAKHRTACDLMAK